MTVTDHTPGRGAVTSAPISDVIASRWSPRAFRADDVVDETKLTAALEAARWAASASNTQPWRFIVARRGSDEHATIVSHLMGFNQLWAGSAGALIVNIAEKANAEGTPLRWAEYDLGQAVATLTLQAHKDGLHVHQMGGVEAADMAAAFGLEDRFEVVSVTALGTLDTPDALPNDTLRERETAPRERKPLDEIVIVDA